MGVRSFCFVLRQINQHLVIIYRGMSLPHNPHVSQARYHWWQAGDPRSRRRLGKQRDAGTGQRQSPRHPSEMEREASRRASGTARALPCHPTTQFAKGTLTFISDTYCSEEQYEEYYFGALGKISKSNIESGLQHMPRRLL